MKVNNEKRQLKIYVCSPYKGKEENYKKAVEYCKLIAAQGHIPFASHVMLHGILDDEIEAERQKGLLAGLEMVKIVDELWIFGEVVTSGMKSEIELSKSLGKEVFRCLGKNQYTLIKLRS